MRRSSVLRLVMLVSAAAFAPPSFGVPITFTYSAPAGSGKLAGVPFNDGWTITAVGDTDDRLIQFFGSNIPTYQIRHISASIVIEGFGTYSFLESTLTSVSGNTSGFAFGPSAKGTSLISGPPGEIPDDWVMLSSIGPVTGMLTVHDNGAVLTSGGGLFIQNEKTPGQFQAVVTNDSRTSVPDQASSALLLSGALAGLVALRRKLLPACRMAGARRS